MIYRATIGAGLTMLACLATAASADPGSIDGEEPEVFEDPYTLVCPDGGYASGCARDDIERAVDLEDGYAAALASDCLYRTRTDCRVLASGKIAALVLDTTLHWQLVALQPADGPANEMIVLIEQDGAVPVLLLSHQTDGYFDAPVAVRDGDGRFLLHLPARNRGLGNADLVLMNSGLGWNWTSADAMMREADRLLPAGFSLASPVGFNLREGSAFALVRRKGDPGCCATGGIANIDFEQSDHALSISRVAFTETQVVGETHYNYPGAATGGDQ